MTIKSDENITKRVKDDTYDDNERVRLKDEVFECIDEYDVYSISYINDNPTEEYLLNINNLNQNIERLKEKYKGENEYIEYSKNGILQEGETIRSNEESNYKL